jgi:hypothetical protein
VILHALKQPSTMDKELALSSGYFSPVVSRRLEFQIVEMYLD